MFFFFKQKTAYEVRISDWSSDVCSSDLCRRLVTWLPMAATCNALISMVLFYGIQGQELGVRLTGWAETRHSILGSDIMAVTVVLSLFCILSSSNVRERFFYSAMLIPQFLFIFLVGCRSAVRRVGKECVSTLRSRWSL